MDNTMEKLRTTGDEQKALFQQATSLLGQGVAPSPASSAVSSDTRPDSSPPTTSPKEERGERAGAVVRDTFSMPPSDSELIDELRSRAARHGRICFRSEIVRAALRSLAALNEVQMIAAVDAVERVEPGKRTRNKG